MSRINFLLYKNFSFFQMKRHALAASAIAIGSYAVEAARERVLSSGGYVEARFKEADVPSDTLVLVFGWAGATWKQLNGILTCYQVRENLIFFLIIFSSTPSFRSERGPV